MAPNKGSKNYKHPAFEILVMDDKNAVTSIDSDAVGLKKVASGKVREIFEVDKDKLLFVATDRISAFDVVLENGIPGKGFILTQLSVHWFRLIQSKFPTLRLHMYTTHLPSSVPEKSYKLLNGRSIQVHRSSIAPLESIVRGYITGSAWTEYKTKGTVHGMPMPEGLKESQKLEPPIWTPSTKAEVGEHDENISQEEARKLVGDEVAKKIEEASLKIYEMVCNHAIQLIQVLADAA